MSGVAGRLFDGRASAQNDQVGQRDALAARPPAVELRLDAFQDSQNLGELIGLVRLPVLLGRQADAATVGTAAQVGSAEGRRRRPGRRDQFRNGEAGPEHLVLEH